MLCPLLNPLEDSLENLLGDTTVMALAVGMALPSVETFAPWTNPVFGQNRWEGEVVVFQT
jgi:hypothetical protein